MTALTTINETDVFDDAIDELIERRNQDALKSSDGRSGWSYYYAAKSFVRFAREEGLGIINGIREYTIRISGEKTNTYNHKLGAAKSLAKRLIDTYQLQMSAEQRASLLQMLRDLNLKRIAAKELSVGEEKFLTEDEWRQFVARCHDETVRLLAAFMYETGSRISEALGVRLAEIEYDRKVCTIYIRGKGSKDRTAEIERKTLDQIRDHFAADTWLFEHSGRQFSRVSIAQRFRLAGLETIGRKITPHMMRHSFATRLDEEGRPLQQIQRLLGHASPVTTEAMYAHAKIPKGQRHIDSGLVTFRVSPI